MQADETAALIRRHWLGDEPAWFKRMGEAGLTTVDWPAAVGGNHWSRQAQLALVNQLAQANCPLMPASITLLAPLLIHLGSKQQRSILSSIAADPAAWDFNPQLGTENRHPSHRLYVEDDDEAGTLKMILDATGDASIIGTAGQALPLIATHASPLWLIHEYKLAMVSFRELSGQTTQPLTDEVTTWMLEETTLDEWFLRHTQQADRQIALMVTRQRLPIYTALMQQLGYYGLLGPPPLLSGNEPLPFESQRRYVCRLRHEYARDDVLQQDQLFEQYLSN